MHVLASRPVELTAESTVSPDVPILLLFYCFSSTVPRTLVLADGQVSAPLSPKQKIDINPKTLWRIYRNRNSRRRMPRIFMTELNKRHESDFYRN